MRQVVAESDGGTRLDVYLAKVYTDRSRAAWQRIVDEGLVAINSVRARSSTRVAAGDTVEIAEPRVPLEDRSEDLPILCLVHEDEAVVVIDKQPGVVVHPAPGHSTGTLVDALLARFPELRGVPGPGRPGIVHRLDRDTSGLMVVARTPEALADLQHQMKERTIEKRYLVLVEGNLEDDRGLIDLPIERDQVRRQQMAVQIAGKPARTLFTVLERFGSHSYLEAKPVSGRTHQIRVHFAFLRHPVAGDRMYGSSKSSKGLKRQFLHATRLAFASPLDGSWMEFSSPLPGDLERFLSMLRTG